MGIEQLLALPEMINRERESRATTRIMMQELGGMDPAMAARLTPGDTGPLGGTGTFGKILSGIGKTGMVLAAVGGRPIPAPRPALAGLGGMSNIMNIKEQINQRRLSARAAPLIREGKYKEAAAMLVEGGDVGPAVNLLTGTDVTPGKPPTSEGGVIVQGLKNRGISPESPGFADAFFDEANRLKNARMGTQFEYWQKRFAVTNSARMDAEGRGDVRTANRLRAKYLQEITSYNAMAAQMGLPPMPIPPGLDQPFTQPVAGAPGAVAPPGEPSGGGAVPGPGDINPAATGDTPAGVPELLAAPESTGPTAPTVSPSGLVPARATIRMPGGGTASFAQPKDSSAGENIMMAAGGITSQLKRLREAVRKGVGEDGTSILLDETQPYPYQMLAKETADTVRKFGLGDVEGGGVYGMNRNRLQNETSRGNQYAADIMSAEGLWTLLARALGDVGNISDTTVGYLRNAFDITRQSKQGALARLNSLEATLNDILNSPSMHLKDPSKMNTPVIQQVKEDLKSIREQEVQEDAQARGATPGGSNPVAPVGTGGGLPARRGQDIGGGFTLE